MMINKVDVNNRLLQIYSEKWTELCKALDKLDGNCGQDMPDGSWYKYDRQSSLVDCMNNIKIVHFEHIILAI